jgi:acetylornithine aminotransferase
MTMADSYFGAYGSAARRNAGEWFSFDWAPCAGCPRARACDEHCEHWASIPFDEIGGFLFEPGSSSGLVRFPPEKLIRNIVAAVRASGGLILVNEVTTGLGRTGLWFGFQHYRISPDIVAIGKGIGNGYPVSVAALAPGVSRRMEGTPLKYAQSHQNDPLGAAVARAVIEVIETGDLIEHGKEIGALLLAGLQAIAGRTDRIEEIRGRGLMVAIELADDTEASFTTRVHRQLAQRGYIVARRPGLNVLRLDPSLTIPREEIEGFLATFEESLA